MQEANRRAYVALWLLAAAFGWIEAAAVTYLRDVYFQAAHVGRGAGLPLAALPMQVVWIEIVREACTLVLLGAAAWLAASRWAPRIGAFLLMFGVWDLAYYAVLRLVAGWPQTLTTWDVLFLIPLPWAAPVWAPASIAALFVAVGSYLFWTPDRLRRYTATDAGILLGCSLAVIGTFLVDWKIVLNYEMPQTFPAWLFWAAVACGCGWFVYVEHREKRRAASAPAWLRVHVRSAQRQPSELEASRAPKPTATFGGADAVSAAYDDASRRLGMLLAKADEIGKRLERVGHELYTHPGRLTAGSSVESDTVRLEALPTADQLIALTDEIRQTSREVKDLREHLVLLGRVDLVHPPDAFFH